MMIILLLFTFIKKYFCLEKKEQLLKLNKNENKYEIYFWGGVVSLAKWNEEEEEKATTVREEVFLLFLKWNG